MTEFTRTMVIQSHDLGRGITFMLTFNSDDIPGIYRNVFPTAWKVTNFGSNGAYMFRFAFKSSPGVSAAQLEGGGRIVSPLAYTPINFGEQTSLLKEDNSYHFSTPTPSDSEITIKNETNSRQDFGVGTFDHIPPSYPPSTLWLYKDVGAGSTLHFGFNYILRGYVTSDYQEGEILRGQVNSPIIFQEDITKLEELTHWKITCDPSSGVYAIQRVD